MSIDLKITYKDRNISILATPQNTIKQIKLKLEKETKVPVLQQELSYKQAQNKIVLTDNQKNLKFINLKDNNLLMKNLGKQIRWEHVFYIEYLGPIIILPIFYALGKKQSYTDVQTVALVMGILHYIKRQYQTAYVHVFSRESMPFKRVMINSLHYWVLFALLNSIQLYLYPSGHTYSRPVIASIVGLWALFQYLNYKCHTVLSGFRKNPKQKTGQQYVNPTKARQIPFGFGYDLVSCANYFWQALGWIAFSLLTRNYTAYLFTLFSIAQMAQWAKDKHRRYKKQFGDKYPKGRKAMFPYLF